MIHKSHKTNFVTFKNKNNETENKEKSEIILILYIDGADNHVLAISSLISYCWQVLEHISFVTFFLNSSYIKCMLSLIRKIKLCIKTKTLKIKRRATIFIANKKNKKQRLCFHMFHNGYWHKSKIKKKKLLFFFKNKLKMKIKICNFTTNVHHFYFLFL